MAKKRILTDEERKLRRKEALENYRHRIHRFTLQFSLGDQEAFEWFSQQKNQGAYLKGLILEDKARKSVAGNHSSLAS